jgi:Cdc6-like AAA superfamily ATPase
LNSYEFQTWASQTNHTLFCPGIPGAGKTFVTSIVVDYLLDNFKNDATVGIAFLYFDYRRAQEQTPANLLASLVKQLVQQQPSLGDKL